MQLFIFKKVLVRLRLHCTFSADGMPCFTPQHFITLFITISHDFKISFHNQLHGATVDEN